VLRINNFGTLDSQVTVTDFWKGRLQWKVLSDLDMHELSIAKSILDSALHHAEDNGFKKILSIHLRIGRLSGIELESLRFCFDVLSAETIAQKAKLAVDLVPLRGKCSYCKGEFDLEEIDLVCPRCNNQNLEVVAGTELLMDRMEVE